MPLAITHTCALVEGGVWCWGDNGSGQLGDSTAADSSVPVAVSGLGSGVVAIAVGSHHSCAVTAVGGVECWGANLFGQLGDGTTDASPTPVPVAGLASGAIAVTAGRNHACVLTSGGGVLCWGGNDFGQLGDGTAADSFAPVTVADLHGVSAISLTMSHTCALTSAGGPRCWGNNSYGQLGNGYQERNTAPVYVVPEPAFLAALLAAIASLAVLGRTRSR